MLVKTENGSELLKMIPVEECKVDELYSPITCALGVVKCGGDFLLGWNNWRQEWEIFGGCREEGESIRACVERECREELGLSGVSWTFLGLMRCKLAPDYFSQKWREEYGAVFGATLPVEALETIETCRADREEIGRIAFYREIKGKEKIAAIDEKLLEFWK